MKIGALQFVLWFMVLCSGAYGQCTYTTIDADDFEFQTNDPYLVPGTVYHLVPQTFGPHTGTYGLYLNFVNNLPAGTVVYDRPYTVCPGQTYRISVWLKETWNGSSNVTLNIIDGPGAGTVLDTWTGVIGNNPWINWQSNAVIPTTGTLRYQLITNGMAGSNDLSMDDLELQMCPIPDANAVTLDFCVGNPQADLYNSLSTNLSNGGNWTGPSATTNGFQGTLDPATASGGAYVYTIPGIGVCPDSVETITVNIFSNPDVDDIPDVNACGSYTLPAITGTSLSGAQSYYTGPNGTGTAMAAGTVINTSQLIYIFDGTNGCLDEESFNVTIAQPVDAGTDAVVSLCPTLNTLDLFDAIIGTPSPGGTWSGPSQLGNGSQGTFDPVAMAPGVYEYILTGTGGCPNDTAFVTVFLQAAQIDLGNDTTVCADQPVPLDAGPGFDTYLWQDGSTNQTFTANAAGQYWCQVGYVGGNIIFNGDFEQGDTLFTTDYILGTGGAWGLLSNPGTYAITTSPNLVHNNFQFCADHTSGAGNQMVVNGASTAGTNVWCQTVNVQPNTNYDFSTWVTSVENTGNVAILQFSINGVNLGNTFSPSTVACNWQSFNQTWNSGASTSAQICIVNQNISGGGNDFAIDDIYFAPICTATDTIEVFHNPLPIVDLGNDTTFCDGGQVTLDAQNPGLTYLWNTTATTQTIDVTATGQYSVDVTDAAGCIGQDTIDITVNPFPIVDLGNDTTICVGETITLDVTGLGQSFLWSDNSTNPTLTVGTDGTYWVDVDALGCVSSDTMILTTSTLPVVDLGNDTTFCEDGMITLDVQNPGLNTVWNTTATSQTINVNTTGQYYVDVTNADGCLGTDTIDVTVNPFPVFSLGNDTAICDGETVTFDANGAGQNYLWNDNSTGNSITVGTAGTYAVAVTTLGCTTNDTVILAINPIPVFDLGNDTTLCENESLLLDPGIVADIYQWSNGSNEETETVLTPDLYALTVTTNGCVYSDQVNVSYIYLPIVSLPADTTICETFTADIFATTLNVTDLIWSTGATEEPFVAYKPETVWVRGSNECGVASDTIKISTEMCECFVYVPNSFTPNGDGINDLFFPTGECDIQTFEFQIFNRWGELLWTTDVLNEGWDGKNAAGEVQIDTYIWRTVYTAYVNNDLETFVKYGHVNVIR